MSPGWELVVGVPPMLAVCSSLRRRLVPSCRRKQEVSVRPGEAGPPEKLLCQSRPRMQLL